MEIKTTNEIIKNYYIIDKDVTLIKDTKWVRVSDVISEGEAVIRGMKEDKVLGITAKDKLIIEATIKSLLNTFKQDE